MDHRDLEGGNCIDMSKRFNIGFKDKKKSWDLIGFTKGSNGIGSIVQVYYNVWMDRPGKVANPARGQLNREMNISLSVFAPENLVSRDGFGSPVPRQPAHLHTQAEPGADL